MTAKNRKEQFEFTFFEKKKIEIGIEKHSKKSATGNHFDLIKTRAVLTVQTTGNAFSFSGSVE